MVKYVKGSLTSGCVGIWWLLDSKVIGNAIPLDSGYNDGNFIHYDNFKNHSTEWHTVLQEQAPDDCDTIYPKGFKSIERGRVVYNLRTMCYEIVCSEEVAINAEAIKSIVEFYDLSDCRYDIVTDRHYHIAELTGNPALDELEYGVF